LGFSQIPSPSKPKIGSVLDVREIWEIGVDVLLTMPSNVSSSPSYVPGVGSEGIVAFTSWRTFVPPAVTSTSSEQLVLYPTAGHSVNGGVGVIFGD
jgi:hypothetical protein